MLNRRRQTRKRKTNGARQRRAPRSESQVRSSSLSARATAKSARQLFHDTRICLTGHFGIMYVSILCAHILMASAA